jgi:hypothetical protein
LSQEHANEWLNGAMDEDKGENAHSVFRAKATLICTYDVNQKLVCYYNRYGLRSMIHATTDIINVELKIPKRLYGFGALNTLIDDALFAQNVPRGTFSLYALRLPEDLTIVQVARLYTPRKCRNSHCSWLPEASSDCLRAYR